jgi:hypothetical protein
MPSQRYLHGYLSKKCLAEWCCLIDWFVDESIRLLITHGL